MKQKITLDECIVEWNQKSRRMGCVAATKFVTDRVAGFKSKRLNRYTQQGEIFQHVVATDGCIIIDLAPYADRPRDENE